MKSCTCLQVEFLDHIEDEFLKNLLSDILDLPVFLHVTVHSDLMRKPSDLKLSNFVCHIIKTLRLPTESSPKKVTEVKRTYSLSYNFLCAGFLILLAFR